MARIVLVFVALAIMATVGVSGLDAGLQNAGADTDIDGESWTPDAGNVTVLDESNIDRAYYDHNVTVKDNNGDIMEYGADYIWYAGNGTVKAVAGGGLDGEASATISYGYELPTSQQESMAGLLSQIPRVAGLALPIGALLFLFALVSR